MKYLKNVATLELDKNKCVGCGKCIDVCPHNVFAMIDGKAVIRDVDACMECGACKMNCPFEAVDVVPGVGCAYAIILGQLRGTEPTCGDTSCCS